MSARILSYTVIGVVMTSGLSDAQPSMAQDVAGPLAIPDAAPAKPHPAAKPKAERVKAKPALKAKAASADKAKPPEPWAAVDPGRVAPRLDGQSAPADAAVARAKPVDDPLSLGMKWNGSNTPNYGAATTSGLINEYNHDLGGASAGSGAEVGVKLKF